MERAEENVSSAQTLNNAINTNSGQGAMKNKTMRQAQKTHPSEQ